MINESYPVDDTCEGRFSGSLHVTRHPERAFERLQRVESTGTAHSTAGRPGVEISWVVCWRLNDHRHGVQRVRFAGLAPSQAAEDHGLMATRVGLLQGRYRVTCLGALVRRQPGPSGGPVAVQAQSGCLGCVSGPIFTKSQKNVQNSV
jgi:hypothetical protein